VLNTRIELPASRQALPAIKGQISFQSVRFRYRPDGTPVLHDISLEIRAGEVVGIVGRSGSGKSTLTKLLQRLYMPEAGQVRIDGIDLALVDPAWLRRQIGVVLQENLLFNRSIRENIAVTDPGASLDRVMVAARLAGAHGFISEMPEGYDTLVGEHGANLSGGQRQRIAIARALVLEPRILILDEPTSALDVSIQQQVLKLLASLQKKYNLGFIFISHDLAVIGAMAHRVAVMKNGSIVEIGDVEKIFASPSHPYTRTLLNAASGGENSLL